LAALGFCRVRARWAVIAFGIATLAVLMTLDNFIPRHIHRFQFIAPEMPAGQLLMWLKYYSPITRVFEFAIGCITASYFLSGKVRIPGTVIITSGVAAIVAAMYLFSGSPIGEAGPHREPLIRFFLVGGSAVLIYGMSQYPEHAVSRLLSSRPARVGGDISYSTYLLHPFLLVGFVHPPLAVITEFGVIEWAYTMIAALASIYFVSYAGYRFIEVPTRQWLRRSLS
jgi:peptidoglycan/LPS O-acetylase OafA/YrhL